MQRPKKIKKTKKTIRRKAVRKRCVRRARKPIPKRTPFGKGLIKLVALVTIISLNWFGLAAIGQTLAYFNDAETSSANDLTAGTLDFSLNSGGWGGGEPYNLLPGDSVSKVVSILDNGNLGFQYKISVVKNSGDDDFCNALQLTADIGGGATEYSGVLVGAAFGDYLYSNPDAWTLTVSLPGSSPEFTETGCDFDFIFEGWQTVLPFGQGFSDTENDNNYLSVTSKYSPIADSNIRKDTPGSNYGTGANLRVRSKSGGGNRRSFIKFDFSFPGGTTILSANLKLYMSDAPATSRTYEISSSSADWTESTITWNNAPPVASLPTDTAAIGTTAGQWVGWDVTSDLQAFLDGANNYGWQIRDASENSATSEEALLNSRNSSDPSLKPVLEVAFRSPAQNPGYAVINEVYPYVGSGKGADPTNEWVEIFNPTGLAIDISSWQLCDNNSCDTIPALSPSIPSRGFAVIAKDITTWANWTNIPAGAIKIVLGSNIGNGLANTGDRVILKDNLSVEIDAMSYGSDTSKLNPAPPAPGQGYSLARIVKGWDNGVASDWVVSVTPNPGTNPSDEDGVEIMRFTDAGIEVAAASQGLEPLADKKTVIVETTEVLNPDQNADGVQEELPVEEMANDQPSDDGIIEGIIQAVDTIVDQVAGEIPGEQITSGDEAVVENDEEGATEEETITEDPEIVPTEEENPVDAEETAEETTDGDSGEIIESAVEETPAEEEQPVGEEIQTDDSAPVIEQAPAAEPEPVVTLSNSDNQNNGAGDAGGGDSGNSVGDSAPSVDSASAGE